jgi:hypothetical protein
VSLVGGFYHDYIEIINPGILQIQFIQRQGTFQGAAGFILFFLELFDAPKAAAPATVANRQWDRT